MLSVRRQQCVEMLKNMLQYIIVNHGVYGVIVYCYCISFTSGLYLLSVGVGVYPDTGGGGAELLWTVDG